MTKNKEHIGFGFIPSDSKHHFLILIPKSTNERVLIYERFEWGSEEENIEMVSSVNLFDAPEQKIDQRFDRLKCALSYKKWKQIDNALKTEFNLRLKELGMKSAQWKTGQTPVHRLFGKELTLLCWAIEDSEIRSIPTAIKNWQGLKPEERWWLYTMTNASTGDADKKYGWRTAIRYALTENPVTEKYRQTSLFDKFVSDSLELYEKKEDGSE